jgi:hypothetical protein
MFLDLSVVILIGAERKEAREQTKFSISNHLASLLLRLFSFDAVLYRQGQKFVCNFAKQEYKYVPLPLLYR